MVETESVKNEDPAVAQSDMASDSKARKLDHRNNGIPRVMGFNNISSDGPNLFINALKQIRLFSCTI